ncbi:helix-turn-helix domain-containing protein [Actinomadura flavalba]|uniref:helix-turn-helix domain-containing protein n=1 Tax=Actinomadura flavalba TaxID=1120938 RepID=UPI00037C16B0|nr:PucR family transcriptional regulator [Actinomadura flavalba]
MAAEVNRGLLAGILRSMAEDEDVIADVVATAREHSPGVARLPVAETRRHIVAMLGAAHGWFEDEDAAEFDAAAALGSDRAAQGVPITSLIQGVQAGRSRAIEIVVARARAAGVPDDVVLDSVLAGKHYTDTLERHVINGYHTAELALSRTARDVRTQVLRRLLLADGPPPPADEVARAGLDPDLPHHCVLSTVSDPVLARVLEQRLSGAGGVFGLVEGRLTGLTPRLPASLRADALIVTTPAAPLADIRPLHGALSAAVRTAEQRGATGVHTLADLAGETALAAQPVLAAVLCGTLLAGLDRADTFHREIAQTALTFLDHGQRLDQTAAALHAHPNTIRYRLTRFHRLTGTPLAPTTVLDTLRWWWSLHTWLTTA